MIKVGIYGSAVVSDPIRKQLLRLLLRHPDVDLRAVASPGGNTVPLAELHPVYAGETELTLERVLNLDKLDVLFVIDEENVTPKIMERFNSDPGFRLVVLGQAPGLQLGAKSQEVVYGLAECNRKTLVRGARAAVCPRPEAQLMELALFPLAKNGMLCSDVRISLATPCACFDDARDEAARLLGMVQPGYDGRLICEALPAAPYGRLDLTAVFESPVALEEAQRIYNETYDDHNFVYVIDGEGGVDEDLRGSNKCLIRINCHGGRLVVNASMDALTKGMTGNAVHLMNLLFGLYERTGLSI
ncbi:MAG: hypothetical protein K2F79_05445 [Muribaculaceae bacterium]|nr:hypothetical protein [Muribaculaceae bacterium]